MKERYTVQEVMQIVSDAAREAMCVYEDNDERTYAVLEMEHEIVRYLIMKEEE